MPPLAQHCQKQNHFFPFNGSPALIAILLALGLFFRFVNLDKKVYWLDEMLTSFQIAGYSAKDLKAEFVPGGEITVQDIQKYQHVQPERGLLDVISSLAVEDPKYPPLYFILARLWVDLFGDSTGAIRGLSAFLSLFVIPSLYWLCRELFDSPHIAWMAVAFMAVSPFHVLYAQEARPYSLWILMTVLSSAALLRAMRLKTVRDWGLYAVTLVGGIYSHVLFALVTAAHGIYVAGLRKVKLEKSLPYLVAGVVAVAAFLPWAVLILFGLPHAQETTGWIRTTEVGPLDSLKRWTLVFSSGFIDTGGTYVLKANYGLDTSWIHLVRLPILFLTAYSLFFIYHKASTRIWTFVFALTGSSVIPLLLPDLILGWQMSAHPRFLTPYYLGALLSVAYLLAAKMVSPDVSQRKLWKSITVVIIVSGIVSCAISSDAETWWNKGTSNPQVARIINQATRPLLISTSDGRSLVNVFSLIHVLDPKVRIRVIADSNRLEIPEDSTDVFLINPPELLRQRFERGGYRMEPAHVSELWHLTKKP
jgi:uncharacterized membrane protein